MPIRPAHLPKDVERKRHYALPHHRPQAWHLEYVNGREVICENDPPRFKSFHGPV
jgi:hypothetical protein